MPDLTEESSEQSGILEIKMPLIPQPQKIVQVLSIPLGGIRGTLREFFGYDRVRGKERYEFTCVFPSGGLMTLADVSPFRIIGGHISSTLWTEKFQFVAADMELNAVPLQPYTSHTSTGMTWRPIRLFSPITGENPFANNKLNTVKEISHIFLYNPGKRWGLIPTDAVTMLLVIEIRPYELEKMNVIH
jgi:hypothetical protein